MTQNYEFFYFIVMIILMMTAMSYLIHWIIQYHIKKIGFTLTSQQIKGVKWLISSVVTALTGYFCLLYLLLLR